MEFHFPQSRKKLTNPVIRLRRLHMRGYRGPRRRDPTRSGKSRSGRLACHHPRRPSRARTASCAPVRTPRPRARRPHSGHPQELSRGRPPLPRSMPAAGEGCREAALPARRRSASNRWFALVGRLLAAAPSPTPARRRREGASETAGGRGGQCGRRTTCARTAPARPPASPEPDGERRRERKSDSRPR